MGTTDFVTNGSGTVAETLDYYPYGGIRLDSKVGPYGGQKRKFIGQEYDAGTNLSYLNARYYNGTKGNFISEDPLFVGAPMSDLTNPQNQNSYSYSNDNPITKSDPSGKCVEDGCFVEASAVGGFAGFVGGIGMQYASDVNSNIQRNGLTPGDFVSNLSSPRQYGVSAAKGTVVGGAAAGAAILGAGAIAVGAVTSAATAVTDYVGNRAMGQATMVLSRGSVAEAGRTESSSRELLTRYIAI